MPRKQRVVWMRWLLAQIASFIKPWLLQIRIVTVRAIGPSQYFRTLIHWCTDEAFFTYVKLLSPAAIDLELRSLTSLSSLRLFLCALKQRLRSHRDFEAVQTILNVFLRIHGEVLVENATELRDSLHVVLEVQKTESKRMVDQISAALGTLSFVRDVV